MVEGYEVERLLYLIRPIQTIANDADRWLKSF
jgi:hypothetical protein